MHADHICWPRGGRGDLVDVEGRSVRREDGTWLAHLPWQSAVSSQHALVKLRVASRRLPSFVKRRQDSSSFACPPRRLPTLRAD